MTAPALQQTLSKKPTLVLCPHPLIAEIGREVLYIPFLRGETIKLYLDRLRVPVSGRDWYLTLNDTAIGYQAWDSTRLQDGDLISLRARARDGGSNDSNKTIRTVLTIAVLAIAQQYSGATQVLIASLGSFAVAKLFPPVLPPSNLNQDKGSPTYSLSGSNNRLRPFEPLPALLGQHRMFADLGAKTYTEFVGEDQYLYQVFNFGITDITLNAFKIGDTLLTNFSDYELEESDGTGALTLFPSNVDTIAGAGLVTAGTWIVRTSSPECTGLSIEITGFLFYSGDNGLEPLEVTVEMQYRAVGTSIWQDFVFGGAALIIHSSRDPVRWGVRLSVPVGQYEVQVRRVTADPTDTRATMDLSWSQLRSYQPDTADYTGQKRVALKIRANNQLQGQVDTFNAIPYLTCDVWSGAAWVPGITNNPAYLFLYWARGKFNGTRRVFGAGLPDSRIDLEAIKDWATYCSIKSLSCNLIFDRVMTVAQQLAVIARCGRAAPTRAGGILGAVWDEGGQPVVAQFGMSNIRRGSMRIEYAARRDVDEVVVNFVNPDLGYQQDSVRATVPGVTDPINALTIDLMGCTDKYMAGAEANLEAAGYQYRRRRITWETDIEGLVVRRGDIVTLSHDLTQWGYSGRLVSGTDTVLVLDRQVPFSPGYVHYIGLRFPDGTYGIMSVDYVAGSTDTITLTSPLTKPAWQPIYDYIVGDEVYGSGGSYLCVSPGTSGSTEPVWPGTYDYVVDGSLLWVLNGTAFPYAPNDDADGFPAMDYMWWFAPQSTPGKKVKIIDFVPKSERHIQLIATDEDDNYYFTETDPFSHTPITIPGTTPTITNVSINDTLVRTGNGYAVRLTMAWDVTDVGVYGGAIIRAAPSGELLKIVDRTYSRRSEILWAYAGNVDIEITLLNRAGEYGVLSVYGTTYAIKGKNQPPNNVTGFAASLDNYRILLSWDPVPDADLLEYEIREGTLWDTSPVIARITGTRYSIDITSNGAHYYLIKARDTSGNLSADPTAGSLTIDLPAAPVITSVFDKENLVLSWVAVAGDFPIVEYEIRYGTGWATGANVGTIKASSLAIRAHWVGARRFWVAAIDAAGNVGIASGTDVSVTAPGAPTITRKIIDNYVLLGWTASPGTLPIAYHEIRRGAVFASAEVVGNNAGSFSTIFESAASTYTYWIVGVDVAGNIGTEASIVALVNSPPDFILREDWLSDWSGTKSNAFITHDNNLLVPVNTTETWTEHFVNNSWATPQDEITAGYDYYAMPSETTASYEQEFDYGAVLQGTLISVIRNTLAISGSVTVTTTISTRKLVTDVWTDNVGVEQFYATDFQYVKINLAFTAAGGDDLLLLQQLNVQLSVKQITDSGTGTANAADIGGTLVSFNKAFIAAESITVTPKGTSSVTAVYDFAGGAYPTEFYVYLFDETGTRISGDFSWNARGN